MSMPRDCASRRMWPPRESAANSTLSRDTNCQPTTTSPHEHFLTHDARNPTAPISANQPKESTVNTVQNVSELAGRILLAVLFLLSGLGKIGAYAGTAAYMSSLGVPAALLPIVIAAEVLGALAIIAGWKTRVTAVLLAG